MPVPDHLIDEANEAMDLRAERDRYRQALEQAHDEMQANRLEELQIVLNALNQKEETEG